jgi:hypothetical protein
MKEAAQKPQRSDQLRPDMPETLYSLGRAEAVRDPSDADHELGRVIELTRGTHLAVQAYLC